LTPLYNYIYSQWLNKDMLDDTKSQPIEQPYYNQRDSEGKFKKKTKPVKGDPDGWNYGGEKGGHRPGLGPKPARRLTSTDLLDQAEKILGKPLAVSILEGYRDTILDGDRKTRVIYEKMLLDKTATTLLDVDVQATDELVREKRTVFRDAVKTLLLMQADTENRKTTEALTEQVIDHVRTVELKG
jgi:hypothetical protein